MTKMVKQRQRRVRLDFASRRAALSASVRDFMTDNQGHRHHEPHLFELGAVHGAIASSRQRALVAERSGVATFVRDLQPAGALRVFIDPGNPRLQLM